MTTAIAPTTAVADRVPPTALVLAGIGSVQVGGALGTTIFPQVGPSGAALVRVAFAGLVALLVLRPTVRGRTASELGLGVAFGLVLGLMNLTFYEALDRMPLGVAVAIEFAGPLGVAVVLSGRRQDRLWALLAALGIVALAGLGAGGRGIEPLGLAFILTTAACWAAYILLSQRTGRIFPGTDGIALALVVAVLVPAVPGVLQGGGQLLDGRVLALGAAVAVLSSLIPYTFEAIALRRMAAGTFGVLMSLEPAVGALAGLLVLGQRLSVLQAGGIACVVIASVGVSRRASRRPRRDEEPLLRDAPS